MLGLALTLFSAAKLLGVGRDAVTDEPLSTTGGEDLDGAAPATGSTAVVGTTLSSLAPTGPYVEATLMDGSFTLSGVVPSAETAAAILQAAENTYAPFVRSELVVDDQLPPVEWLGASPDLITSLATVDSGTIRIENAAVTVTAQAPSQDEADRFATHLTEASGLPVTIVSLQVSGLAPAVVTLQATGGQILMAGKVPDQETLTLLTDSASAAYGAENVVANITVDPAVASALWMRSGDQLIAALAAFPDYRIRFDGPALTGFIGGGTQFAPNSSELPADDPVLNFVIDVMGRDPSLVLLVEGHTDTDGDETFNLTLSQRRADAVATYLTGRGVAPERISAVGKGEVYPIAANDNDDGKARNRRVELTLSTGR